MTTIAEWSKTLSISRQQGYEAIKRCEIPVTDGKVDPEYATHLYNRHTRKRAHGQRPDSLAAAGPSAGAGGPEPVAKIPGYETSRARREAAEATTAEIKLADLAGTFLVKAAVDSAVFEIARALRDGLMNCARRIAADVAPLTTAEECEAVIDREHRVLLESMAHSLGEKLKVVMEANAE
jgi:hypothetical protein